MNKQTLLNIGLIIALAVVISLLFKADKFKGIVAEKEKKIEELEEYITHTQAIRDTIDNYIVKLEDSIKIKDVLLLEKDKLIIKVKGDNRKKIGIIIQLTQSEADSLLEKKYPDEQVRSKTILVDLQKGEESAELLEIETARVGILSAKVGNLEDINLSKDLVIRNLESQLEAQDEINAEREEQLELMKKEVKRQKRQKIGAILLGGVAVVLALLSG